LRYEKYSNENRIVLVSSIARVDFLYKIIVVSFVELENSGRVRDTRGVVRVQQKETRCIERRSRL
jgi:hypothetical protein